jgi:hypothetical protein
MGLGRNGVDCFKTARSEMLNVYGELLLPMFSNSERRFSWISEPVRKERQKLFTLLVTGFIYLEHHSNMAFNTQVKGGVGTNVCITGQC